MEIYDQIKQLFDQCNSFLIVSAKNLDWDSYWACMWLYIYLTKIWKSATVVCETEKPENYSKLWYENVLRTSIRNWSQYDMIIACDTWSIDMLWTIFIDHKELFEKTTLLNIDHHSSNTNFWNINLIQIQASATCVQIYWLLEELWVTDYIDKDLATHLLLWIWFDTSGFRNAATNKYSLEVWSKLLEYGANHQLCIEILYRWMKFENIQLRWDILVNLKSYKNGKIIGAVITQEMLKSRWFNDNNDEGDLITWELKNEIIPSISWLNYSFIITECSDWTKKVSLRSMSDEYNVSAIAKQLWWWWHIRASWAKTNLNTDDIINLIVNFYK